MLDPFNIFKTFPFGPPLLGFVAGIFSGIHCLGMCGPISFNFNKTFSQHLHYHGGRFLGYLFLTYLFLSLGKSIEVLKIPELNIFFGLLMGFFLILFGLGRLNIKIFPFIPWDRVLHFLNPSSKPKLRSFLPLSLLYGFSSAFLPCGVLWGVVGSLSLTQSYFLSFLGISSFFLGTLPLLLFTPGLLYKFRQRLGRWANLSISFLFILVGLLSLYHKLHSSIHELKSSSEYQDSNLLCQ